MTLSATIAIPSDNLSILSHTCCSWNGELKAVVKSPINLANEKTPPPYLKQTNNLSKIVQTIVPSWSRIVVHHFHQLNHETRHNEWMDYVWTCHCVIQASYVSYLRTRRSLKSITQTISLLLNSIYMNHVFLDISYTFLNVCWKYNVELKVSYFPSRLKQSVLLDTYNTRATLCDICFVYFTLPQTVIIHI